MVKQTSISLEPDVDEDAFLYLSILNHHNEGDGEEGRASRRPN